MQPENFVRWIQGTYEYSNSTYRHLVYYISAPNFLWFFWRLACIVFNCISIFTDLVGFIITATKPGNFIELTIPDRTSYALLSIFMCCSLSGLVGVALYESWMVAIPRFAYGMKALLAGLLGIFIVNVSFQLDSRHDNFAIEFFPNRFDGNCIECWGNFSTSYYNGDFNGTFPNDCTPNIDCFDFDIDRFNATLSKCQIQYPHLLANEVCDDSLYNSRDCAFDGGDCLSSWYTSPYFVISVSVIGESISIFRITIFQSICSNLLIFFIYESLVWIN